MERNNKGILEMMVGNSPGTQGSFGSQGDSYGKESFPGYDTVMKFFKRNGKTDYRKVPKNYKSWVKSIKNK